MTQEEKELLLIDLCARLPYGVKCYEAEVGYAFDIIGTTSNNKEFVFSDGYERNLEQIKPYLRSLSSMTDEEKKEANRLFTVLYDRNDVMCGIQINSFVQLDKVIEWLNKRYFDWRGLIPKGLAIEAPEGMYK